MDYETRLAVIEKIRSCPFKKVTDRGLAIASAGPEFFERAKDLMCKLIETMDEYNQVMVIDEDGTQTLCTVNVNQVLAIYDPILM